MSEKNCGSVWGVITSPLTYWKMYSNISQRNASAGCGSTPAHWLGHNHTLTYLSGFTVAIKWKYVSCCFMQFEVLVKENRRDNETLAHECFHLLCHPVPAHCSACKQNLFFCFFFFFFLQCMVLQVCVLLPWGELEHCAYAVCYTMVTRAKHQNIQHAKALYKIDQ